MLNRNNHPLFKTRVGQRFASLVVIDEDMSRGKANRLVRCDCGNVRWMQLGNLTAGTSKSCGSCGPHNRFKSAIGGTYGFLTVISEPTKTGNRKVVCRCECGNVVEKNLSNIKQGRAKSCGCVKRYSHRYGTIYYLVDPITNKVRYVGQTVQKPNDRGRHHVTSKSNTEAKSQWMRDLFPDRPIVFVAEHGVPVAQLDVVEMQHINCQRYNGADLLNVVGVP